MGTLAGQSGCCCHPQPPHHGSISFGVEEWLRSPSSLTCSVPDQELSSTPRQVVFSLCLSPSHLPSSVDSDPLFCTNRVQSSTPRIHWVNPHSKPSRPLSPLIQLYLSDLGLIICLEDMITSNRFSSGDSSCDGCQENSKPTFSGPHPRISRQAISNEKQCTLSPQPTTASCWLAMC